MINSDKILSICKKYSEISNSRYNKIGAVICKDNKILSVGFSYSYDRNNHVSEIIRCLINLKNKYIDNTILYVYNQNNNYKITRSELNLLYEYGVKYIVINSYDKKYRIKDLLYKGA